MKLAHILVLGGAGGMGRHLARTLAAFEFVEQITIAGLEQSEARKFCQSLNGKATFLPLNVDHENDLHSAIASCDLVVNTVGPFYRFAEKIISAAITLKRPYIDICDDIEPTEALLARDQEAKQAGIPLICGLGASPGLTNILARLACDQLDDVLEVDTIWDISGTSTVDDGYLPPPAKGQPSAALVHWMHCCSGSVKVLENGAWLGRRPVEPSILPMPNGEEITGWLVAHPEPLTLARRYSSLLATHNYMTGPGELFELIQVVRDRIDAGELTLESAAILLADDYGLAAAITAGQEQATKDKAESSAPCLMAIARGMKDGETTTVTARLNALPPGGMGAITGIPAALGVKMLYEGRITETGAFAPESIIDPQRFFELFAAYCDLDEQSALFDVTSRQGEFKVGAT